MKQLQRTVLETALILFAAAVGSSVSAQDAVMPSKPSALESYAFPLRISENHRHLVDRNGKPFLIVGDTPQGLMGRLTEAEAESYFADREAHGFNTLGWIDVECAGNDYKTNTDATTPDGIRPFTGYVAGGTDYTHYDLSKPNEAYFARLDHMIELASKHHLAVFLDPIETVGWLATLHNNGRKVAFAYGQYLGNRYRKFENLSWLSGNDFNTWTLPDDDNLVQAVAKGIRSVSPEQLQTVELHIRTSSSFDDPRWVPLLELNGTYTYSPTYIQMLHSYNQRPVAPTFLMEGHYELNPEILGDPPDYPTLILFRKQAYWTMLSGGTGQFYGNGYSWSFKDGWQSHIDTPGVEQIRYWKAFFNTIRWQDLVPDQDHSVVTAGFGSFGNVMTRISESDYATVSRTADGSAVVAYIPTPRAITVNMASLSGPVSARWFDPSNGMFQQIAGTPLANKGAHQFIPPGKNHDGDPDWVLLLERSRATR
jgi:hypothetical protein